MNALVLTQLSAAKATQQDYTDVGIRQTIHHAPARGVNRQISLGPSGITISRGNILVAIPMTEILRIADAAEPRLSAAMAQPPRDPRQIKKNGPLPKVNPNNGAPAAQGASVPPQSAQSNPTSPK